jgi:hypothetical protein
MKKMTILAVAGLTALLLMISCRDTAPAEGPEPVELRTYSVPHGYENDVRTMLRNALGSGETRIGRADLGPAGKLVVVAPEGIHEGVRGFIDELERLDTPPPLPSPVTLTYWIVAARPMGTALPSMLPDVPVHPKGSYTVVGANPLNDVSPALEQIVGIQGPTAFSLVERLQLISFGDARAHTQGRVTWIEQRATVVKDSIVADLALRVRSSSISTQVKLQPGQFLVLGQSGYSGDVPTPLAHGAEPEELTLYYVIASDLAP